VSASHLDLRQAMAVDQQAVINGPLYRFASRLCTDHPSALHPGYGPYVLDCPLFDLVAANNLPDDNGWVKGADGVRAKVGQHLEFEYSTTTSFKSWRLDVETLLQRDFRQIGIKLDIQNYPNGIFFGSFLPQRKASPPTGAVAGRYDIAKVEEDLSYDP